VFIQTGKQYVVFTQTFDLEPIRKLVEKRDVT